MCSLKQEVRKEEERSITNSGLLLASIMQDKVENQLSNSQLFLVLPFILLVFLCMKEKWHG